MKVMNEEFIKTLLLVFVGVILGVFVFWISSNQNNVSSEYDDYKIFYDGLVDKGLSSESAIGVIANSSFTGNVNFGENDVLSSFRVD